MMNITPPQSDVEILWLTGSTESELIYNVGVEVLTKHFYDLFPGIMNTLCWISRHLDKAQQTTIEHKVRFIESICYNRYIWYLMTKLTWVFGWLTSRIVRSRELKLRSDSTLKQGFLRISANQYMTLKNGGRSRPPLFRD